MFSSDVEFYRGFFDNYRAVMMLIDPITGDIINANAMAIQFYGWDIEQFKKMKISQINTVSIDDVKAKVDYAAAHNNNYCFLQHRLCSGEIRDVEVFFSSIDVRGRNLLNLIVHDRTTRLKAEEETKRHTAFEHTILHLSQNFINMPLEKLDDAIKSALALITDYCEASRAAFWKYDWEQQSSIKLYEHDNEPLIGNQRSIMPISNFRKIFELMKRGEVCLLNDDEDVEYSKTFSESKIQSSFIIPLQINGNLIGSFSISTKNRQKRWSEIEIKTARIFSQMLASVLERLESENLRNQTNESFRLILDSTNDAIAMFDRKGTILNINATYMKRIGKSRCDVIGLNLSDLLPRERYETLYEQRMQKLKAVFNTGEPLVFEDSRDGLTLENRFYPVYKAGKLAAVTMFSTDVSYRKKAEQEAKRHEEFMSTILHLAQNFINMPHEQLESAINNSLSLVTTYCCATRATIWKFNWQDNKSEKLYEHDNKPSIGCSSREISLFMFKEVVDCINRGDIFQMDCDKGDQYRPFLIETGIRSAFIIPLKKEDNAIGTLVISMKEKVKAWSDSEITAIRIFSEMLTSVLQRMEGMLALIESKEEKRLILDSTSDGIAMVNLEGEILLVNDTFVKQYGQSKQELKGKRMMDLLPIEQYGTIGKERLQKVRETFRTGKPVIFEDSHDNIHFESRYYPVFRDGKISAVTLFLTDISARKEAEEEAKSKMEYQAKLNVVTDFFTNVSHELKTPLSVILLQLELMELYLSDKQKMRKLIGVTVQNTYRLTRLVRNILDITKIDAGSMNVSLANVQIVSLLRKVCGSVTPFAKARGIQMNFKNKSTINLLPTDSEKIERILLNLLSNAIKHTGVGGKITIRIRDRKEGGVFISVEDTGEGIPKDKQKMIFDRFAQVDTMLNRQNEGSGIGLALVKSLVEMLRGTIHVKSRMGKGSTFIVELPIIKLESEFNFGNIDGYDLTKKAEMELSDLYI